MEIEPQRETLGEIPLSGGQLPPGIVRVGNAVRRPAKGNAAFVHDLLLFLEDQGFPFAPRFFGRDEQGRDILSYLEGETWPGSGSRLSDELLRPTKLLICLPIARPRAFKSGWPSTQKSNM